MVLRWLQSPRLIAARPYLAVIGLSLIAVLLIVTVHPSRGVSPFSPLLYLPLIIAILTCPFEFVLITGLLLSAVLVGVEIHGHRMHISDGLYSTRLLTAFGRGMVLNLVAILGGLYARQYQARQNAVARRLQEADALLNTFVWINTSNSLEDCVDIVLLALRQIKPYLVASVFLRDEAPSMLTACGASGAVSELQTSRLPVEAAGIGSGDGSYGLTYVQDTERGRSHPLACLAPSVRSFAAVPLLLPDQQLIGMLYLGFDTPDGLTASDCQLIEDFALRVAFPLQKVRLQERLQGMAFTDAMTGLKNYGAFRSQLDEELRRATRYNHSVSLLLIDIDLFKQVNDRFGHQMGDRVLAHFASVLRASVRDTDLPARYGGEEFVVLCPETESSDALVVAERIRQAVESAPYNDMSGGPVTLTVSIGVATFPADAVDEATLVHHADAALYQAKRAGRNRVVSAHRYEVALVETPHGLGSENSGRPIVPPFF